MATPNIRSILGFIWSEHRADPQLKVTVTLTNGDSVSGIPQISDDETHYLKLDNGGIVKYVAVAHITSFAFFV